MSLQFPPWAAFRLITDKHVFCLLQLQTDKYPSHDSVNKHSPCSRGIRRQIGADAVLWFNSAESSFLKY